jgi:hypothetical protein
MHDEERVTPSHYHSLYYSIVLLLCEILSPSERRRRVTKNMNHHETLSSNTHTRIVICTIFQGFFFTDKTLYLHTTRKLQFEIERNQKKTDKTKNLENNLKVPCLAQFWGSQTLLLNTQFLLHQGNDCSIAI